MINKTGDHMTDGLERSVRRQPWASVGLRAGDPGPLVCVGTRIERVEYGQLSVLDHQGGVVDCIECILLGPVGIRGRSLGVQLISPLIDLCLDVFSPSGS